MGRDKILEDNEKSPKQYSRTPMTHPVSVKLIIYKKKHYFGIIILKKSIYKPD